MIEKTITVMSGLEDRPTALFVQSASKYRSKLLISMDNKTVNAKSIMGVMSLGVVDGDIVRIFAEGDDETEAVEELVGFLQGLR